MASVLRIAEQDIRVDRYLPRIARLDADGYEFLSDPEPLVKELRASGRADLFTFTQGLTETSPKYGYPMEWDNFAALEVSTFENWWTNQIKSYPRNRARQAEKKGVTLRQVPFDDTLVRGIWEAYNECPVRRGNRFSHYGKDLETVRREEATFLDTSVFIGAFLGAQLIGFIKLTWDKKRTQANLMNILSMIQHRDKAPTNALIAEAVRFCAQQKISYLVYQRFAYGKKEHDSLSHFKEINGFQRIDVPRYYVPITALGSFALRLGLHHKLSHHLPESLVAKLRKAREAWYNRGLKSAKEAL
ncbi:MAG TPA: hypothetical protein VMB49_08795 [Acidobacteriaceae bacterium]|nr:hypothetical protein [Acidobacteriaceae bacterium]